MDRQDFWTFIIFGIFLVGSVNTAPNSRTLRQAENNVDGSYAFDWRVQDDLSGNDYGHRESKAIDDVTHGEYFVRLPDGRLQTVTYFVDPQSGFRATISYDREVAAAPANLPPPRITSAPLRVRVPSPPVRPVINNSLRNDKSLKLNNIENVFLRPTITPASSFSTPDLNSFSRAEVNGSPRPEVTSISTPQINGLFRPEVVSQSSVRPDAIRAPIQNTVQSEPLKRPKDLILSGKNRLDNLFQDDRHGKSEFNVHNKEAFTKTEAELAGQDFSEPVFYPYKTKIVKHEDSILD